MALLDENDDWPLSDREYAFGWLVFGKGMSIEDAAQAAAGLPAQLVEDYSLKQRRALAGFNNMIECMIGNPRVLAWADPVV